MKSKIEKIEMDDKIHKTIPDSNIFLAGRLFPAEIILSIILVLVLISPWIHSHLIAPLPFYQNYDPEIQYLMNSLLVFKGQTYYYLDHPGTPLEIIGSIILIFTRPFISGGTEDFIYYHLQNPNLFLSIARFFMTLASIGCALYMKKLLAASSPRLEEILLTVAVPLMFYVIHPESFETLILWSHTSFNFPFGTLLLLAFYKIANKNDDLTIKNAALLGLFCGILTSVMVYFSAWIIGIMVFIFAWYRIKKTVWRKILITLATFGVSAMTGFVLMLIPAFKRIGYFWGWIHAVTFHQGTYGSGPEGITSIPSMITNLLNLDKGLPVLFLLAALLSVIFVSLITWKRSQLQEEAGFWALGTGILIQIIVVVLLVLKHPMDRYLLPLAAIIPVFLMVILQLLNYIPWLRRVFAWATIIFVFAWLPITAVNFFESQYNSAQLIENVDQQNNQIIRNYANLVSKKENDLIVLWTYESYSPCYSLWYGNEYAWYAFNTELSRICPNQYSLTGWVNSVDSGKHKKTTSNLNWDLIFTTKHVILSKSYLNGYGTVREFPYNVVVVYRN
jgi:hypothetical protein